jgi:hypothetical protein
MALFSHFARSQANGIAAPSFTLYCLDTMDPKQDIAYQERIVMETAAAIYSGES